MARVTHEEVKEIMDNCTVTDAIVDTFIGAATELITQVFTDGSVGDTLLKEIERWLTAHMIASTLSRTTSDEKLGDASVKFTGTWGKRLESTPYGQMCLVLDTSGKMANAGKMGATIYAVEEFE
jgi:hypothetical protein